MPIFLFTALFIVGLLMASVEFGRRIRLHRHEEKLSSGPGVIEAAVFGLMSLLLAFSFSGAISRSDTRRELIVQETNAVGTARPRVDLLPEAAQPQIRDDFRARLDARVAFYQHMNSDRVNVLDELAFFGKTAEEDLDGICRRGEADFLNCRPDARRRLSQRND